MKRTSNGILLLHILLFKVLPLATFYVHNSVVSFLANVNVSLYVVVRPSVIRLSSLTFMHPTQAIKIFGNVSTPFGTLAIY